MVNAMKFNFNEGDEVKIVSKNSRNNGEICVVVKLMCSDSVCLVKTRYGQNVKFTKPESLELVSQASKKSIPFIFTCSTSKLESKFNVVKGIENGADMIVIFGESFEEIKDRGVKEVEVCIDSYWDYIYCFGGNESYVISRNIRVEPFE